MLNQVTRREGAIERVPRGETPVLELDLEPHQYVAAIEIRPALYDRPDRKTVDWRWTAYVVNRLGVPAAAPAEVV